MAARSTERTFGKRGGTAPDAMSRVPTGRNRDAIDESRLDADFSEEAEPKGQAIGATSTRTVTGIVVAILLGGLILTGVKRPDATLVISFIVLSMVLRPEVEAAMGAVGRFMALRDAGPGIEDGDRLLLAMAGVGPGSALLELPPAQRWCVVGGRETAATRLVESILPRALALGCAVYVAVLPSFAALYGKTGMMADVMIIGYAAFAKGFESLVDFARSIYRVRLGVRRSPWFAVGAVVGALFFVVNDRLDLVPLSPSDALIKVTFGSQDALIAAIDKSGIVENVDATFAHTKDGMTINRTRPDGTQSDPVKNRADWEKTKTMLEAGTRIMWYVDLFAIAAACGFALNTLMVRGFGFAGAGRLKSDD